MTTRTRDPNAISLADVENAELLKFDHERAKHNLRVWLSIPFACVFLIINVVMIYILIVIGMEEWQAIEAGKTIERLVTPEVIMTMIGATTVQLGAVMYTVMKGIFNDS